MTKHRCHLMLQSEGAHNQSIINQQNMGFGNDYTQIDPCTPLTAGLLKSLAVPIKVLP